jgi:hypothetical protein
VVLLCLNSCQKLFFEDGKHSYFIFENKKSNLDIVIGVDINGYHNANKIPVSKSQINSNKNRMVVYVNSTNERTLEDVHTTWEAKINSMKNYDTLKLFILDYAKIMNMDAFPDLVPFDSVFLQRYDLTIKDLDRLGWRLSYPPDERMKDVKMYPPYNE